MSATTETEVLQHHWPVRLTHWLMAAAILIMIGSG
jgi:cytochrome b subunit of formate dehydrogenase